MKRVALYGGAFDPPHIGHASIITTLLNSELVDEIWIIPSGDKRYDKQPKASEKDRKNMLELFLSSVFGDQFPVKINTIQFEDRFQESGTMDLIDELRKRVKEVNFYFVVGIDNIEGIPMWRSADRLMREVQFLAVNRLGEKDHNSVPSYVTLVKPAPLISTNASSQAMRTLLGRGKRVEGFVPLLVADYIRKNKLYVST